MGTEHYPTPGLQAPIEQSGHAVPFLDYYTELGFVPTRQVGDRQSLFRRREELYLRLGIPPALFRGSDILEFGPGSGENASFTATLGPHRYHIVDALDSALSATRDKISEEVSPSRCSFTLSTIEAFSDTRRYDIVLCEGLLPFQSSPVELVRKVASFVRPGGTLVVTCADATSMLAESLRRYAARRLLGSGRVTHESVDAMVDFFRSDLDALPGMTRDRRDWVMDQLLHPWSGTTFSIADALAALELDFRPTGASPSVFEDWRWYKDYFDSNADWVAECRKLLDQAGARLVERRSLAPLLSSASSSTLRRVSDQCYDLVCEGGSRFDRSADVRLVSLLDELLDQVPELPLETQHAVVAFQRYLMSGAPADLADFRPWWGRGQQYLALTRNLHETQPRARRDKSSSPQN